MFRLLIVEDVKGTLKQLALFISEALKEPDGKPCVVIHTAEAVEDAEQLILGAAEKNQPYHAAILDFKLPRRVGLNPELPDIDQSLCLLIRQKMRSTLIAHITAYMGDEVVREHLRLVHQEQINPKALVFSKADSEYALKLVERLRAFLYGMRIEEQIALVFGEMQELGFATKGGTERSRSRARAKRSRSRAQRSLTHDIAALRRDITAHWHYLDEQLQDRIRIFFWTDNESPLEESDMFFNGIPPTSSFPLRMESPHFILHYGMRNPATGKGRGSDGVRDKIVVLTYVEALERLYSIMTGAPWNRPAPVVGREEKTHVFIYDSDPFIADDPFSAPASRSIADSVPYIVLPCRTDEATTQAELHRAEAEAVHEATHVFNFTERPFDSILANNWEWYDEGFAVFMETLAVAGNPNYIRFLKNWIDMPEVPLDHPNAKYQAGMFLRYLAKRLGHSFINDVWTQSAPAEEPLQAMQRLLPPGITLISPNPNVRDLFASGYCMDPFFLWDHESAGLAPEIFARYGERAVTDSLVLRPGQVGVTDGTLDHLACRYYRFYLKGEILRVKVALTPHGAEADGGTLLKAEVASVTSEGRRVSVIPLRAHPGEPLCLSAELTRFEAADVEYLILVVSNCGTRRNLHDGTEHHDDGKSFAIEAIAS